MEDILEELAKAFLSPGAYQSNAKVLPFGLDKEDVEKLVSKFQNSPWVEILRKPSLHARSADEPFSAFSFGSHTRPSEPTGPTGPTESNQGGNGKPAVQSSLKVDIREMESYVAVYIDLPGVKKQDINLNIAKNCVLTLSAEKQPYGNSSDTFLLRERDVGVFQRTIQLPHIIDVQSIVAKYEDGVLVVRFSKNTHDNDSGRKVVIN